MNIIFFGSTSDSVLVASALHDKYPLKAVVTQPAKPIGREQTFTKTSLELWAIEQKIPCLTFARDEERTWKYTNEDEVTNSLSSCKPDLFITACYGQKLPKSTLALPTIGSLNIHPSILPRWRGSDPVPWTIIAGDAQTGVTISNITDTFDSGDIVGVKKIAVTEKDTSDTLRTQLFILGAELLLELLPEYIKGSSKPIPQKKEDVVIAKKFTRDDGYVPFALIEKALAGMDATREERQGSLIQEMTESLIPSLTRLLRALSPWPGVWTTYPIGGIEKRIKLLSFANHDGKLSIEQVQLEGKKPVDWNTFETAYLKK